MFNKLVLELATSCVLGLFGEHGHCPGIDQSQSTSHSESGRNFIHFHNLAERTIYGEIASYTVTSTTTCSKAFLFQLC